MSRLYHYITEESGFPPQLAKDCKFIFRILKKSPSGKNFLWRGSKHWVEPAEKFLTKKNRKPTIISQTLHEIIDTELYKLFKWRPRSEGLFTSSRRIATPYGLTNIVLPIGKFTYIIHPDISLLWKYFDTKNTPINTGSISRMEERIENIKKELKNYKSSGLPNTIRNDRFECIIKCKEYYLISSDYEYKETLDKLIEEA